MKKILSILLAGAMLAGCVLTGCSDSSSSKSDSSDGNTAKVADPIEGVKATASTDKYRNYYEIFVNSFCDSNGDETGDLQGIISQLDYLNDGDPNSGDDLGVDAIWLTPIMPSKSYHKYDVEDYYNIDPDFGTLDDFDKLIEECHKRGINVILDLVLNHASSKNPLFTKGVVFDKCSELIVTDTMRERKGIMEDKADAFVICAGGMGTFEEFFEVLTLKQLNRHTKPIIIYNVKGYYNSMLAMLDNAVSEKFMTNACNRLYTIADTEEEVFNQLENYVPFTYNKYEFLKKDGEQNG